MTNEFLFICGGAWSGKTARAVHFAKAHQNVVWIGTASPTAPQIKERIESLQAERPRHWRHLEAAFDLPDAITKANHEDASSLFVVDSVSQWISNEIARKSARLDENQLFDTMARESDDFITAIKQCAVKRPLIIVSADFGQSMPPQLAADRTLRMCVGLLNTRLTALSNSMNVCFAGVVIYSQYGKIAPT